MGNTLSGQLPEEELNKPSIFERIKANWSRTVLSSVNSHQGEKTEPTQGNDLIKLFGKELHGCLVKEGLVDLNILEIMAGNCFASELVYEQLSTPPKPLNIVKWLATDIRNWRSQFKSVRPLSEKIYFEELDTVDAIAKVAKESKLGIAIPNILLCISPPPMLPTANLSDCTNYADYYACKDYIKLCVETQSKNNYIVFFGEIGQSDGSSCMDSWLSENKSLSLRCEKNLTPEKRDVFGGPLSKKILVYKVLVDIAVDTAKVSETTVDTAKAAVDTPPLIDLPNRCGYCKKADGTVKLRCSRCRNIYYCCAVCQKTHWPIHKPDCIPKTSHELKYLKYKQKYLTLKRNFLKN